MKKMNNSGFSFIEMLVSVLITGVIMIGIGTFISTSRYTYQSVNISATLQEEALAANTFISELLKEAKAYGYGPEENYTDASGKTYKLSSVWIYARDNDSTNPMDANCYFIIFEREIIGGVVQEVGCIRYSKMPHGIMVPGDPHSISGGYAWVMPAISTTYKNKYYYGVVGNPYALIADKVMAFSIDDPHLQDNGTVIKGILKFKYFDTEFTSNINVLSRNISVK